MLLYHFRNLVHSRELLWVWTKREILVRYKQSILGSLWAVLQPLSTMLIFTVIFGYFVKVPSDGIPYPIFFYTAILPWTLFANSITFSVPSLINNMNLVTKVYFPREILPLANIGAALLDYLIASILFFALLLIYHIPFYRTLIYLPLLLTVQIILSIGIALLSASVVVFFRDIRFVVPLILQLWMYMTPIIYPLSQVPERFRNLYMLNPMASVIDGYRRITLLGQPPQWDYIVYSTIISIGLFISTFLYFKGAEDRFADVI
jgi:lipopolysaccharide transport system permease protein